MKWMLGLSAWIIQDGNYGDVRRDDRLEAAVEFGFEDAPSRSPRLLHVRYSDAAPSDPDGDALS